MAFVSVRRVVLAASIPGLFILASGFDCAFARGIGGKDASFVAATGPSAQGALIAPFEGIHGGSFQDQRVNPVVVRVKSGGFYGLIPPGEAGNEAGTVANLPAERAFEGK